MHRRWLISGRNIIAQRMIRKRERKGGNNIKSSWELSTSLDRSAKKKEICPEAPSPPIRLRVSAALGFPSRVLLSTLPYTYIIIVK